MRKIYVAGRMSTEAPGFYADKPHVAAHGYRSWRSEFLSEVGCTLPGNLDNIIENGFPEIECICNGISFIYTGPYLVDEFHGLGYAHKSHGTVAAHGGDSNLNSSYKPERKKALAHRCLEAVDRSDVVLAWIEEGAYGTAVEIGYALSKGKDVAVSGPGIVNSDLWFLYALADKVEAVSPSQFVKKILTYLHRLDCKFGSPIEKAMYDALTTRLPAGVKAVTQYQIGTYRVDIAVVGSGTKIVVECDGHAFHQMTKEQVAHDKKRDRYLQAEGWRVLRFTGSEIYNKLSACAGEVIAMATRGAT